MEAVISTAIDKTNLGYHLTFENIDYSEAMGAQGGQVKSKLIESDGTTIFDAIRKGKKKLANKLYFSHMQILIISEQIAKEDGIKSIINFFLRDTEPRENVNVIISQDKTAKDLLNCKPISVNFIGEEIKQIIEEDNKTSCFTEDLPIYKLFNKLENKGEELILPVFSRVENAAKTTIQSNGSAVFKDDKMIGYVTPADTHYVLFVNDDVSGGLATADLDNNGQDDTALEILRSKTERSFSFDGSQVKISIKIKAAVFAQEIPPTIDPLNPKDVDKVTSSAEKKLTENVENVLKKVQTEFSSDIFGFGFMIYQKDFKLWQKLKNNWDHHYFKNIQFKVTSEIKVKNSAILK